MTSHADLEIGLHRRDAFHYRVDLRYVAADSGTDDWVSGEARFDLEKLRKNALDDEAYGTELTASLFADAALKSRFSEVCRAVAAKDQPLRLRLLIGPSALTLQTLRWERLQDPERGVPLLTQHRVQFSRYLTSSDWRPVRLRNKSELKCVLAVANPANLNQYNLPPVALGDRMDEMLETVGLGQITRLVQPGQATADGIRSALEERTDILLLACHGSFDSTAGRPILFLEDADGNVCRSDGIELARRIEELEIRPRLVVLLSCDSEGTVADEQDACENQLAALGPRLAQAGVAAVLAIHGSLSLETAQQFLPLFLNELAQDGYVDRAMSVARSAIQSHRDWWKPVLFTRLRTGRLWYSRGIAADAGGGLDQWRALLGNIHDGSCTPILGPGMFEYLLGSRREVTRQWAESEHFPLSPTDRDKLPAVAQYLATRHDFSYAWRTLQNYLSRKIDQRYGDDLRQSMREQIQGEGLATPDMDQAIEERLAALTFDERVCRVGLERMQSDPTEPHRVLARLGLPIYVTTNHSSLLKQAIELENRKPQVELYRWKGADEFDWPPSIFEEDEGWRPSAEQPLVYHLFGHLADPESVVLTEDDYFDYLIGLNRNKNHFPPAVGSSLNKTALLFLGFRMDDWGFRVLFRSIINRGGSRFRRNFSHVAVQVDPEESYTIAPEQARVYLEKFFDNARISLYWGSVQDFVDDLRSRIEPGALSAAG